MTAQFLDSYFTFYAFFVVISDYHILTFRQVLSEKIISQPTAAQLVPSLPNGTRDQHHSYYSYLPEEHCCIAENKWDWGRRCQTPPSPIRLFPHKSKKRPAEE
jgi:hypothetical protein